MRLQHLTTHDAVRAELADGGTAMLRPLDRGESEPLLAVFDGMSDWSRYRRYLVGMPRLPKPMLDALTNVDGCRHAAWLATVDGRPSGIGRYVRDSADTADLAFEVVDEQQGRGLGSALLDTVATLARANGLTRITATVHPANSASVHLLRRFGLALHLDDGVLEGEAPLRLPDPARVDRGAVLDLAVRRARASGHRIPCAAPASSVA
jgi:GNAT superfamily N-acetyltransferase